MTFDQAVAYMSSRLVFGIRLGLERFEALLDRVGNPHHRFRSIHVAGTNGKGSTTQFVASILQAAGYRTGGYYSPYVFNVRERVMIDNAPISEADFARWVAVLREHIQAMDADKGGPESDDASSMAGVTEFELKTALAFCYFAERAVDFAAIEVGLGGRLDATNVITPMVSIITNIGLDHTEHLGPTHSAIAREKAGIIKPRVPVVTAALQPDALQVIKEVASERCAELRVVSPGSTWRHISPNTVCVDAGGNQIVLTRERLLGSYQNENVAVAVAAVEDLRRQDVIVPDQAIVEGVRTAWLPGRMQVVGTRPLTILDGAHNAEGAQRLAEAIRQEFNNRKLTIVLGMVKNHEAAGVLKALGPLAERIIVTQPPTPRAKAAVDLAREAAGLGLSVIAEPHIARAFEQAVANAPPDSVVLITGSFYTIGEFGRHNNAPEASKIV